MTTYLLKAWREGASIPIAIVVRIHESDATTPEDLLRAVLREAELPDGRYVRMEIEVVN